MVDAVPTTLTGGGDGDDDDEGNAPVEENWAESVAFASCGDRDGGELWSSARRYAALAPASRFGGMSAAPSGSRAMVAAGIYAFLASNAGRSG